MHHFHCRQMYSGKTGGCVYSFGGHPYIEADRIDYDDDKPYVEAHGHVVVDDQGAKQHCASYTWWINEHRGDCVNTPPAPPEPGQASIRGQWEVAATQETHDGHVYHLRGKASLRGTDLAIRADEIDYNEEKAYIEARGDVAVAAYPSGAQSHCAKFSYWTSDRRAICSPAE